MGMNHCRTDILVTKQLMNRPNSVTIFEKMIGEMENGMPLKFLHLPSTKKPPTGSTPAWRLCSFRYDLGASPAYPLQIATKIRR